MRDGQSRLASSFGGSLAERSIARLVDSDMSAHFESPTAGSIVLVGHEKFMLLDNPRSIRRLWHRGSREVRLLYRAMYDARSWGRAPLYIAPINPATGVPYGLPEGIVPVVLLPVWAATHATGTAVPASMLRLARRRCVPWSDSATGRSIVEHDRVLIERLNAVILYVQERLLRQ